MGRNRVIDKMVLIRARGMERTSGAILSGVCERYTIKDPPYIYRRAPAVAGSTEWSVVGQLKGWMGWGCKSISRGAFRGGGVVWVMGWSGGLVSRSVLERAGTSVPAPAAYLPAAREGRR